jgi:hypothetical protein
MGSAPFRPDVPGANGPEVALLVLLRPDSVDLIDDALEADAQAEKFDAPPKR